MPTDRYQQLTQSVPGRFISKRLGLPQPPRLRRYEPGDPLLDGPAHVGAAPGGRLSGPVDRVLKSAGVESRASVDGDGSVAALVFDASGIASTEELDELYRFFHPTIRSIGTSGRILVLGTPPEMSETPRQAVAQRALEGFVRSIAKEIGQKGTTANLAYVAPG